MAHSGMDPQHCYVNWTIGWARGRKPYQNTSLNYTESQQQIDNCHTGLRTQKKAFQPLIDAMVSPPEIAAITSVLAVPS